MPVSISKPFGGSVSVDLVVERDTSRTVRVSDGGSVSIVLGQTQQSAGAVVIGAILAAGVAVRIVQGSGTVLVPVVASAASGERSVTGAAGAVITPIASAGAATRTVTGTGAATTPETEAAAAGERLVVGTAAATIPAAETAGEGSVGDDISGTAEIVIGAVEVAAIGERSVVGTGEPAIAGVTVAGAGIRTITGAGAMSTPAIEAAGTGERSVAGAGAAALGGVTVAAAGTRTITGASEILAAAIAAAATGERSITGTGAALLGSVAAAGTGTASSAPTLDIVTFADNNDGTPATLDITYTGNVTGYRVYIATGDATFDSDVPLASELYNAAGATGADEYTDFAVGSSIDITGLTSASNSSIRVAVALIKSADGSDPSNVVTETVSGLDFTVPAAPTAATDVAGDTITLTFAEAIYGSQDISDWVLSGAGSNSRTIASVAGFGTSAITLELSGAVVSGALALAYTNTDSDLRDADANNLANFSGLTVTNNLVAGPNFTDNFARANETLEASADWSLYQIIIGNVPFEVVSEQLTFTAGTYGRRSRTTTLETGDVYAQMVYKSATNTARDYGGVALIDTANTLNYELMWESTLRLRRVVGTTETDIGTPYTYTPAANDVWRIERIVLNGTTVRVRGLVNGVEVTTYDDTDANRVSADVYGGVFAFVNDNDTIAFDDFESGNV